jgi:hypothetical protein
MPWGLRRHYGTGSLHFITWSCYKRKPLFGSPARRDLVLTALESIRVRYRFAVIGYVVMPRRQENQGRATPSKLHRSFVGSRPLRVRLRFLRMTIRTNVKNKVEGVGQECPTHTIRDQNQESKDAAMDIRIWALRCGPIHLGRLDPSASLRAGSRMRPSPHEA